jgi:cell division protein FtsI/penicillin-binding protein 2
VFAALLLVSFLVARVVDVQGLGASKYAAYGNSELYQSVTLPALRGSIYDRNGNLLAVSVPRVDVVSDDYLVGTPDTQLAALAHLLRMPAPSLRSMLSEKSGYVTLARQVGPATEAAVQALDLPNVSFVPDPARLDPDSVLFSPLLGIVGFSGTGLTGLEYQQQRLLEGVAGSEQVAIGSAGEALPNGVRDIQPAHQGDGLVLTLDQPLQFEVTSVLSARLKVTRAASGTVVVLDTKTGGILAMVNLVRSKSGRVSPAGQNLAVQTEYQAGSVMKLATISAALQDGIITPSSRITVPDQIYVGGWPFQDAEYHPTEVLSAAQILAQSSNVGTIEIAAKLGPKRLYDQLLNLGFGQQTALDWPGETGGSVPPLQDWYTSYMGTVPIGTGEAVTPMQVVDAYNAVANGGVYVPPRLVQATVSAGHGETVLPMAARHRVLDASTAEELLPMLEDVTSVGTATAAQVPGYTVAGKTGTAQIPNDRGGYTPGAWMATFVGFAPARDPALTAIVVINHPDDYYGGSASAPVFSTIMRYALRHFDVPPPTGAAP